MRDAAPGESRLEAAFETEVGDEARRPPEESVVFHPPDGLSDVAQAGTSPRRQSIAAS